MSRLLPNTFQTFNTYVDDAMEMLTGEEYKCLSFATRHILGWQDKLDDRCGVISLTMFEKGFVSKEGFVFGGTGLTRPTIQKALDELARLGFLMKVGSPTAKGQRWQLGDEPDFEALAARHDATKKQRKAARQNRTGLAGKPAAGGLALKPAASLAPKLPLVYPVYQRWFMRYTSTGLAPKLNQIHVQNHLQNHRQISAHKRAEAVLKLNRRDVIFDAVARGYGIIDTTAEGGRIAMIANWLKKKYQGKGARTMGFISSPASVQNVDDFFAYWTKKYGAEVSPPIDFVKFVEHWRAWASRQTAAPKPTEKNRYFPGFDK